MERWIIVNTDNYGSDYPDEKVLSVVNAEDKHQPFLLTKEKAEAVAALLNDTAVPAGRYWIVRPEGYKLIPGFEP